MAENFFGSDSFNDCNWQLNRYQTAGKRWGAGAHQVVHLIERHPSSTVKLSFP
jgi:hypothetical protein